MNDEAQRPGGEAQMPGGGFGDNVEQVPRTITSARRRELARMAEAIADRVQRETKPWERCLLRRMVENLVGDN